MTRLENGTLYNEDMKEITTDNASFEFFRKNDALYVDKTEFIYKLLCARSRRFFFISRPRRFGKSLFCSTLASLFKGEKELFRGLYIYDKYDFKPYPVIHFDFNNMDAASVEDFVKALQGKVLLQAKRAGIDIDTSYGPAMMFEMLIEELYRRDGEVVIIQDEYDAPLTSATLGDAEMSEKIRKILNSFYATIKNKAGMIRFCFITGVVKLANLSIFSAMNNLVDLSMDKEFSGAFGYTDEELDEYFGEGIDEYLEANPGIYKSRDEFREKIREYYDGYRFSPDSNLTVYNPVSIGCFFDKECSFSNYWIKTGSSNLAIVLARNIDLSRFMTGNELAADSMDFDTFDISIITDENADEGKILALLYYTGYLTIKGSSFDGYALRFPNEEVEVSFAKGLIGMSLGSNSILRSLSEKVFNACKEGNTDGLIEAIGKYFDALPYSVYGSRAYERTFQGFLLGLFISTGMLQSGEEETADGRIDAVTYSEKDIWLFELKVDKSTDEALGQINTKGYADKYGYLIGKRRVHKIGLNFSSATRRLESWKRASKILWYGFVIPLSFSSILLLRSG